MMTAGSGAAFTTDLGHVLPVFRHALPAFSADLGHMLAVPGHRLAAFAGDFLAGIRVHCSGASGTRAARRLALHRSGILILGGDSLLWRRHSAVSGLAYRLLRALGATFHRLGFRPRLLGVLRILLAVVWHSSSVTGMMVGVLPGLAASRIPRPPAARKLLVARV